MTSENPTIEEQLALKGLRTALQGESGWYVPVILPDGAPTKVWACDVEPPHWCSWCNGGVSYEECCESFDSENP